ncbi:hypothetical protein KPATCC21470_2930 [Kitasatospora purpeofusca]
MGSPLPGRGQDRTGEDEGAGQDGGTGAARGAGRDGDVATR